MSQGSQGSAESSGKVQIHAAEVLEVPAQAGREADEALQLLPPKSQDKSHTSRHYDFFAKAMATGDDGKPQAGVEGARHPALRDGKRGSGGKTPEERREESSFVVKTMEEVPLERWLTEAPESALRTIASSVKRLSEQENMYRICLLDASLATLKLRPQFDMRVYSTEQGELALEGRELRLQSSDGIPGFVAAIDAFTNCDALLSPQPSSSFPGEEELVTDLRLQLSIDFPGFLATAPGFNVGGDEVLSQLVSSLEKGAKQRAQSAYDSFAQNSTSALR